MIGTTVPSNPDTRRVVTSVQPAALSTCRESAAQRCKVAPACPSSSLGRNRTCHRGKVVGS